MNKELEQTYTFSLNLKMFALANNKELLNNAAMIICQKQIKFTADLMTFASVKERKQNWYAFRFAKKLADSYKGTESSLYGGNPDFLPSWKEAADQCGKLMGNNGVVFFMFMINYRDGRTKPIAIYSCPEGFGYVHSNTLEAAWGRSFEKPLSNPVYVIGKELVPYELHHPSNYTDIDFSRYANDPLNDIYEKITASAETRIKKAEKKILEKLKTADPKKRQGYYLVTDEKPETIPFETDGDKIQPEYTAKET